MIWSVQLVFDCADPDRVTDFWGRALEYVNPNVNDTPELRRAFREANPQYDGRGRIDDSHGRRTAVYVQRVPEPKAERNRIRPEIAVPAGQLDDAISRFAALGAVPNDDVPGEYLDTEGNEFTVVEGLDRPNANARWRSLVIDCLDPERMVRFWSEALGYEPSDGRCDPVIGSARTVAGELVVRGRPIVRVGRPDNPPPDRIVQDLVPGLAFNKVDEPKRAKNRLHIDLNSDDEAADLERIAALGATVIDWHRHRVHVDPEGNEFCIQQPL